MTSNTKTRPNCTSLEEGGINGRRGSERQYQRFDKGGSNDSGQKGWRRQLQPKKGGDNGPIRGRQRPDKGGSGSPIRAAEKKREGRGDTFGPLGLLAGKEVE